jgi:hypothetical protein
MGPFSVWYRSNSCPHTLGLVSRGYDSPVLKIPGNNPNTDLTLASVVRPPFSLSGYGVTLFVAAVTYQSVISDSLPKLGYQTVLDRYVMDV